MTSQPPVLTVRQLLDLCKRDTADLESITRSYTQQANTLQFPDLLNDHVYWSYKLQRSDDISPDLVMVGMLKGSKRTGRVRLVDHTANINCVVAPINTAVSPHQCGQACTLPPGGTQSYHCPYLHLSALGRVVRITQFQVVVERFIISCFPTDADTKNESYVKKTHVCCYLMFSMRDVVCLRRQSVTDSSRECVPTDKLCGLVRKKCTFNESEKRPRLDVAEDSRHDQQNDRASCDCENENAKKKSTESQRLSLPFDRCSDFIEKNHRFSQHIEKDHIDSGSRNQEKQTDAQQETNRPTTTSQVFLVTRKDALHVKHRINSPAALCFFLTVQFLGETQTCTSVDSEASSLNDSSVVANVLLDIYGSGVSLYTALHAGCLYRLVRTSPSDSGHFSRQFSTGQLKRALEQTDTCQCLRVDDDYVIMPVQVLPFAQLDRQMKQVVSRGCLSCDSIYDVCHSDRRTVELVSFRGVIEGRVHMRPEEDKQDVNQRKTDRDKEKLGVSVPQDRTMRIVVRDCCTPDSVVVYVHSLNISYPLGLLRGAVVEFRRVERRISKKGSVYCQFISASSVQVVGLTSDVQPQWWGCGETSLGASASSQPLMRLRQLVGPQTPGGSTVLRCASCQVGRVLSVALRQTCVLCSQLYRARRCGCNADLESSHFTTAACFTVDDGTATAIVYCYGSLVRQLLGLSVSQWTTIQQLVKEHDVNYDPQWGTNHEDNSASDVESYIHFLCSSTRVLRQVAVSLRRGHGSRRREESYVATATRFPDTRMTTVNVQKQVVVTQKWPPLRLQLVAIEPVDHYGYASQLMVSQNSAAED